MADFGQAAPIQAAAGAYRRPQKRMWWLLSGLALSLGALLLFEPTVRDAALPEIPSTVAGEPDLHIEDALISEFHTDGSLKYQLAASQIRYFESQQVTRLTQPELVLFSESDPPWRIRAARGFMRPRESAQGDVEDEVLLRDNVRMEQKTPEGEMFSVVTSRLTLYPDRRYATSDQDVMIDTHVGRTQAVGVHGDLKQGTFELSSDARQRVHTILLPSQFK